MNELENVKFLALYETNSNDAFFLSGNAEEVDLETHPQVQAGTMEASGAAACQSSIFLSIIKLIF